MFTAYSVRELLLEEVDVASAVGHFCLHGSYTGHEELLRVHKHPHQVLQRHTGNMWRGGLILIYIVSSMYHVK